jgi:hypothetical protein
MRYLAPIFVLFLLGAAASPESASAQPFRARQGVQNGQVRSLDEIMRGIRRERPGNLADVQGPNMGPSGDPRYRLKWITPDGRVLWLDTDARTGRVLGVEGDDRGPPIPLPPGPFGQRRGNFVPGGPIPPPGYDRGPPPGYDRGPPPGYDRGPPPGYPQGTPPGYNRGPSDDGPNRGRGFGGRFRDREGR